MRLMAKKKKENLYVDIDADLKRRLVRLADRRSRKLTAEVALALRRYLKEEEPKEGLSADVDEE
jgi:predicted transcriptional regulator